MKLRTQLSLAFFLLAVVPLTGLTLYAYQSSSRAFRLAVEAEGASLTEQLGDRAEAVTRELSLRMDRMRGRSRDAGDAHVSAFEKARRDALAAAEQTESRQILRSVLAGTARQRG